MPTIRTRIAPSPTGHFHIGNARTALFSYLYAKKHKGVFVLRIEDTDRERSKPEFEKEIFKSLDWLGVTADEGPEQGGAYGPYRQSERIRTYRPHLEKLLDSGNAFYCFHTEAELDEEKKRLMTAKENPIHKCEYRDAAPPDRAKLEALRGESLIRFKTPPGRTLKFHDLIRGEITFSSDLMGDFSIAKDLETPLYNFAVVIDDATMDISHVIRGEDHISNTPKQILLQEALTLPTPEYAHAPLILGPDRSKLSSRHGATAIYEFREAGYLPEALVNFMALLGWNPGNERELFTLPELVQEFDLAKVQKAGAVFNIKKLNWLNSEYIRARSPRELAELVTPYLSISVSDDVTVDDDALLKVVSVEQPRLEKLSDINERASYLCDPEKYDSELLRWKQMTNEEIRVSLQRSKDIISLLQFPALPSEIENIFLKEIGGGDRGQILWPLRVSLTGKKASSGPFDIISIIGKDPALKRIEQALEKISHEAR